MDFSNYCSWVGIPKSSPGADEKLACILAIPEHRNILRNRPGQ